MITSAGLVIIYKEKILLVKQKKSGDRPYSIPKGLCKDDESISDTAIRETFEETGISISTSDLPDVPFVLHYYNNIQDIVYKRIFYFVVILRSKPKLRILDTNEIDGVVFFSYDKAAELMVFQQLTVLSHLNKKYIILKEFKWLHLNGFISRESHPSADLLIYNYTEKTKRLGFWNESTLWARGLIVNSEGEIIAYPLRKFFEFEQLLPEFRNINLPYKVYDKIDGCLGILYWLDGLPYIATRNSFLSHPAYKATVMLYSDFFEDIALLRQDYTYFFEIIYPKKKIVIDYGTTETLFLLGAYDNKNNRDVELSELMKLNFPKTLEIDTDLSFDQLLTFDDGVKEGYVIKFYDGRRMKIKFDSFKKKYNNKYL